jgi:hypothetical protein
MPSARPLIVFVLALSAVVIGATELLISGIISEQESLVIAYAILALNIAVSIAGFWMRRRYWWIAYAALSVAAFVLIGAATPISGIWTLARVFLT